MAGHRAWTSLWLSDSYTCEFGFVCQWWLLFSSFQCGYVAFNLFFPFPKSSSASQYANDDWQRPTSIVHLTAREPCWIFTFAKLVSFEHSTGIPCPVISSRRDGNINKRTKLKSFLTLDRRSVSLHRPACVRVLRGQWAIWLAPRLSLATESTGTVFIPSQMSEIACHDWDTVRHWRMLRWSRKMVLARRFDALRHHQLANWWWRKASKRLANEASSGVSLYLSFSSPTKTWTDSWIKRKREEKESLIW